MEGAGSYNDWGYYSPPQPHSTLSPYAAAFSVNRPPFNDVSAPFVDSDEPAYGVPPNPVHYPVHPRSYGYDFFPESDSVSKPYGYSGLASEDSFWYDQWPPTSSKPSLAEPQPCFPDLNSMGLASEDSFGYEQWLSASSKPSLGEAQPYFPSYIPSTIPSPTSSVAAPIHWSSSSGFAPLDVVPSFGDYAAENSSEFGFSGLGAGSWNQFSGFDHGKGKQVGAESSLSSKQTSLVAAEERMNQGFQDMKVSNNGVAHMVDGEKHGTPINADHSVDKSPLWGTIKRPQISGTSVKQSPLVPLEIHVPAPLESVAGNDVAHMIDGEKHGMPINADQSVDKSCPWGTIKRPVQVSDASTMQSPLVPLAIHVPAPSKSFADTGAHHLSYTGPYDKRPSPQGHLGMHLETIEPSSSNNALISDKNVSRDVKDYDIFKGRREFQNPYLSLDNLCSRLSAVEDVNSGEKSFEGGDQCNPAVDSPCWKGAPADHISHYESCEVLPPEQVHKKEKPLNFPLDTESGVKRSPEHSNSYQMYSENVNLETRSSGSPLKCSLTKFASKDCKSDGAVSAGPFLSEPSCNCRLQYLDDITQTKENGIPPIKPTGCESGSSFTEHQVFVNDKSMSQNQHTLCIGGADAGCNVTKCLESFTSHTAEHAKSPSSAVDAPATPENSVGKVSTEKLNVQLLVDTLQNMSELLLYHCSYDGCELKERDCNILKKVIGNLSTCALKNAEEITTAPECLFHQPENSRCTGGPCELQQNTSFKRPQLTKIEQEISEIKLENQFEEANQHFSSERPHWKLPVCMSPRFDAETTKADSMTKDLKRILSENFHDEEEDSQTDLYKNLWLEAEAALCSVSYRARYNQMKIEMEKRSYNQRDMEEQSKAEVIPSSSKSQSSATEVHNYPNPGSPAQDLPVLHDTNPKELSPLKISKDMNKDTTPLTPDGTGSEDLISFIQNYISGTNNVAENEESSVMARYYVLKARADNPCVDTANLEEPSDSAGKLSPEGGDNQNQVNCGTFCQDSPVPAENKADDYEASVVARFHILKSRAEDSSSVSSQEKLSDGVGFSGKRMYDSSISENASEGKRMNVDLNSSYAAVDKSISNEFHVDLEDNDEVQPRELQVPTYYSDGLASDWEHV
ncbi:uncharacterized protein LOC130748206 isoform X3 [Lotus japonicus]|uniref:uncharacterized protein LOC130748206 isoform X3 n=1 Tax=Lotus japonicus TaxID=34305 RepID=UPI002587F7E2|nr:uncharacterized protein LOC130748206 isoform X3 [Lotus japonicus]